eukprot:Selendium_serpulae@DN1637_c0_g1_i1.p4
MPTGTVRLRAEALCLQRVVAEVSSDRCGAVSTFCGVVRSQTKDGTDVQALVFSVYEAMTTKVILQILDEAEARWAVHRICVEHKVGHCPVGHNGGPIERPSEQK